AHATIEPRGLRELHWRLNADQWSFSIRSCARVTVFTGDGNTGTLGYQPRDV
ncbi:hypothetical protein P692DRAFT_20692267, partial [Suillus brevipes Sb2]